VQYASGQFYATEHAVVVTPNHGNIDSLWLYYLLVQLKLERYASGAAQPGIAVNKLEKIHIEIPNMDQQEMFSKFVRQSDKSKFVYQEASNWEHLRRIFSSK
jgi:type I restriction enzyme S subunit